MLKKHKIKFRKQKDSMQCGAACLQMICDFYGLELSSTQYMRNVMQVKLVFHCLGYIIPQKVLGLMCFVAKQTL